MTTAMEQVLTRSLEARAQAGPPPIEPEALLHAAVARGRRVRIRRRIAGSVLAAVTVVAGVAALIPKGHVAVPTAATFPALPNAPGGLGITSNAALITSDPRTIHFSLDSLARSASMVTYWANPKYEAAMVMRDNFQITVSMSRDRAVLPTESEDLSPGPHLVHTENVVIAGRPGTVTVPVPNSGYPKPTPYLQTFVLSWQPVDGVWAKAEVLTDTVEAAVRATETVRFDQAKRCALPFSVNTPPAGATTQSCSTDLQADRLQGFSSSANLVFGDGKRQLDIRFMEIPGHRGQIGKLKAGPYRVDADPNGQTWTMWAGEFGVTAIVTPKGAYTQREVLDAMGSISESGDPRNPATW